MRLTRAYATTDRRRRRSCPISIESATAYRQGLEEPDRDVPISYLRRRGKSFSGPFRKTEEFSRLRFRRARTRVRPEERLEGD